MKVIGDLGAPLGSKIVLDKVMAVGGEDFTLFGRPLLPHGLARVEATIIERTLAREEIFQDFRKRSNYNKHKFFRKKFNLLRINEISITNKVD